MTGCVIVLLKLCLESTVSNKTPDIILSKQLEDLQGLDWQNLVSLSCSFTSKKKYHVIALDLLKRGVLGDFNTLT